MPTYTIYARAQTFTDEQRDALAGACTELHSLHTGAPRSFVQTIFLDVPPSGHYVGGERTHARAVWLYAHIRAGRPPAIRTALAVSLKDAIERIADVPGQYIWIYLDELQHTDMIEFGSVLPPPGDETAWIEAMEPAVRDYLLALG